MRRPRILLVDNIAVFCRSLARNLALAGYEVFMAQSAQQARDKMQTPLDLALVDLQLVAEDDPYDFSGIDLCRDLRRETDAFLVLMTEHCLPGEQVLQWQNAKLIDAYQAKDWAATTRHEQIGDWLSGSVGTHFKLQVNTEGHKAEADDWLALTRHIEDPPLRSNEVEYLFHRLIPKYIAVVDIAPIEAGSGGAGVVRVNAEHASTGLREQVIVKYGEKPRVWTEQDRFDKYVAPLGSRGVAPVRWSAQTHSLAAIAYASVRDQREASCYTLADYFRRPRSAGKEEAALLEAIFFEVCGPWYEAFMETPSGNNEMVLPKPVSLRKYLLENYWPDRDEARTLSKLREIRDWVCSDGGGHYADGVITVPFPGVEARALDPVEFLMAEELDGFWPALSRLCVGHADLHPRNIFVLGGGPCVIDFADVATGHPFRDFALLEASLRFGAVYDFREANLVFEQENSLANMGFFPTWEQFEAPAGTLGQAARLTYFIRDLSRRLTGGLGEQESWESHYAAILLLSLLKLAGIKHVYLQEKPGRIQGRRVMAYLAAGLVASYCAYRWKVAPPRLIIRDSVADVREALQRLTQSRGIKLVTSPLPDS